MYGKDSDTELFCPSSQEFEDAVKAIDSQINVSRFIEMARARTIRYGSGRREKPSKDAGEAEREAFSRVTDFLVSLDFEYSRDELIVEYQQSCKGGHSIASDIETHAQRVLEMERAFAEQFGFDAIEETPEIDKPLANGMTQLGQIIMMSDNLEEVRTLIEEKGASPVAMCGSMTPLELAQQLGRKAVVSYLNDISKMSA